MSTHYHFIGIGGIGMSGLARLLLHQQCTVSGSDKVSSYLTENLKEQGANVFLGHSEQHIQPGMMVIYHSDISEDHPEYVAAQVLQCPLIHRADLLAKLLEGYQTLAVTGTHGKTTTSALLTTVLLVAGIHPSFALGGTLIEQKMNADLGQKDWFVFEADESDRAFLKYFPTGAIVTNIDRDHLNYYEGSEEVLVEAFQQFMRQVSHPDYLFWCGDDPHLKQFNHSGPSYGFGKDCKWRASNLHQKEFSITFDIVGNGQVYREIELALIGSHNVLNALAVFGLATTLGIQEEVIRLAFKSFKGVMRRCEKKGEKQGVLFLDDYAHHPTEIQTTLKGIRAAIKERRLIAVFQPHRYSRTQDCLGHYGTIFDAVDELFITEIFGGVESPIPGLSHQNIIEEIQNCSTIPVHEVSRSEISQKLAQFVQPHDVVVTLGAGDVTKVSMETLDFLDQREPKRLKLGLIFGGSATEHEVSIRSSQHFRECLKRDYYEIEEFGITKQGVWIGGSDAKQTLEEILEGKKKIRNDKKLSAEIFHKLMECDVLIPVLHGPLGEDGTVQGLFEMLGKAYVGCDYRSCAISMDKALTKKMIQLQQMRTSPFIDFSVYQWETEREKIKKEIIQTLCFPVFVKPIHLGSTVGVRKVCGLEQLEEAIQHALRYDTHIIVENGIVGRELEFAVLGNDEITVFPPGEILANGEVYDYASKYSTTHTMATTPFANLPSSLIEEGRKLAEQAYRACGCSGLARVDFFLDTHGVYWFNEINPIPGFTAFSLYPQICAYHGLKGPELMDQLVILGLQKRRRKNRVDVK
jgi:UDP-N-acetylmuramate--alanine ligase